jgi:hypothetical protein
MCFSKTESIEARSFRNVVTENRFHLRVKHLHFAYIDQMDPISEDRKL